MKALAPLFVVLCLACGCALPPITLPPQKTIFEKNPSQLNCVFAGAVDFEKKIITETLSIMPAKVQQAIDKIVVDEERTAEYTGNMIAYCINQGGWMEIHIWRPRLERCIVWHEAAHAYDYHLGLDDDIKWLKIIGDGPGHTEGRSYPSKGVLEKYGAQDWLEDRAVWVEFIYRLIANQSHPFRNIPDFKDARYIQKLGILLEQGFIDQVVHDTVLEAINSNK